MRRVILSFILLLFASCAYANHSTLRSNPSETNPVDTSGNFTSSWNTDLRDSIDHEIPLTLDMHQGPFVTRNQACVHDASGTGNLVSDAFACEAYLPERVNQTSQAITYATSTANDNCWVIISADNDGISGWTQVGSTAYYYRCEGDSTPNQPNLPSNSAWLMQVTMDATPALSSITDMRRVLPVRSDDVERYASFNAAIDEYNDAGDDHVILRFGSRIHVTTNTTVTSNITLKVLRGGMFDIDSGVTLTLPCDNLHAGNYQIFRGSGTVACNAMPPVIYAAWWGHVADGATDDATAINNAISVASTAGGGVVQLRSGDTQVESIITLKTGVVLRGVCGATPTKLIDTTYPTNVHRFISADSAATDIGIECLSVYGNNSTFAAGAAGDALDPAYGGGANLEGGIIIDTATRLHIQDVQVKYVYDGIWIDACTDCTFTRSRVDGNATAGSGTGFHLVAGTNSHASYITVIDGADGALTLLNGSYVSLSDSYCEDTVDDGATTAGIVLQGLDHATLERNTCVNCWIGFAIIERNQSVRAENNICVGCHVGFLAGYFNTGNSFSDIVLSKNRVITATSLTEGGSYPVSGYLIQPSGASGATPSVALLGNYFGKSTAGKALIVRDGEALSQIHRLVVSGNIFEANTLFQTTNFNTASEIMNFDNLRNAIITDNILVSQIGTTTGAQVTFTDSLNVIYANNMHLLGRSDTLVSWVQFDSTTEHAIIEGNFFEQVANAGLYYALKIDGTGHVVRGNDFENDGRPLLLSTVEKTIIEGNNAADQSARLFINWSDSTITSGFLGPNNTPLTQNIATAGTWDFFEPWASSAWMVAVHADSNGQDLQAVYYIHTTADGTIRLNALSTADGGMAVTDSGGGMLRFTNTTGNTYDFVANVQSLK